MVEARMLAGVHFIEMLTAGAKTQERLPLVVALNPQRGDAADFIALFQGLRTKARIIAPYADAQNGHFGWYRGESSAAGAPGPRRAAQTLVPFLGQMHDAWLSVGKPIVVGYSQGAIVAMTLAITAPKSLSAVVSISGRLPPALFRDARKIASGPTIEVFHGERDRAVPFAACKESVAVLKAAGFSTTAHFYPDVGHKMSRSEAQEILVTLERLLAHVTPTE
jgi:phospholipase/carboxylesterase